jgi:hypothetical protein
MRVAWHLQMGINAAAIPRDSVQLRCPYFNFAGRNIMQRVQRAHEGKSNYVLESVRKPEGVDITETELDICIDDELSQPQNLTTELESVSETRLLGFLHGEG